jgi:hypothetical protein
MSFIQEHLDQISTEVGDKVLLNITGVIGPLYLGEYISKDRIKVEETGPYANLKPGDYIIDVFETKLYQEASLDKVKRSEFLESWRQFRESGGIIASGLTSVFGQEVSGIREVIFE